MSKPLPLCDGFHDENEVEYLIEVFGADDGYVEEFSVSTLNSDGSTTEHPYDDRDEEKWHLIAQRIYDGYCESSFHF